MSGINAMLCAGAPTAINRRLNAIAFWDLDSDATDKTGNGHNSTADTGTYDGTWATYTGTNRVTLATITVNTPFTLSAWVNMISFTGGPQTIFASSNFAMFGVVAADSITGAPGSLVNNDTPPAGLTPSLALSTNYHLVVTADGSAQTVYYINGVLVFTDTSDPGGSFNMTRIGNAKAGNSIPLNGKLRCAGVFSDIKNQAWVTSTYNAGTPLKWGSM